MDSIDYIDRVSGKQCREIVMGDAAIKWAYQTLSGQWCSRLLFGSSWLSWALGWYFDSPFSKGKIASAIADLNIDEGEFADPRETFASFNAFFTRKLKEGARPFSDDPSCFLCPADGRLLVYEQVDGDSLLAVKGVEDRLESLFGRPMPEFYGGQVAVVRLCPADYHRYHFPCDATVLEEVPIAGQYHSVNPMALRVKPRVFCINKRSYTLLDSERFGRLAFMEVGAFGVAGIHQTYQGKNVNRMQEKGFFDFGGSTVVLVFQKDAIVFDDDLRNNSAAGLETLVKVGETIGRSL